MEWERLSGFLAGDAACDAESGEAGRDLASGEPGGDLATLLGL